MKLKMMGVPQLVGAFFSCHEKLRGRLEEMCEIESHFGIIALKDGMIQSVSLDEIGECDNFSPFCAQCAYVHAGVRYSVFYGMNDCSVINTFGRAHQGENTTYSSAFRARMMNHILVRGFRDFIGTGQNIHSYEHIFNVMDINEFRLINAHNLTEPEEIEHVFERIESFAGLYFVQIVEAMQDDGFIAKLELEQTEENWLTVRRKQAPNAAKLNLALNSFCTGNYRVASMKYHVLEKILTRYEARRLHYIDSALDDRKSPHIESAVFNYIEKSRADISNEAKYTAFSFIIALPVTFLASLSLFLFAKNVYFGSITKARLILEPDIPFFCILSLLMGTLLLFPGAQIATKIFFKDRYYKQNIHIGTYMNRLRSKLWPVGAFGYFFNAMIVFIIFGFSLLINNNLVFYRDSMVISSGSLRGISRIAIDYSEINDIFKVTRVKRGDKISDGWRLYYLHVKDRGIIKAENIFTSKHEFINRGLPLLAGAIEKEPIEVGLYEEIYYYLQSVK